MSFVFISGDHPRHRFMAYQLAKSGHMKAWVIEQRENFVPTAPAHLAEDLQVLFNQHFQLRESVENSWFQYETLQLPTLHTSHADLNSAATIDFIKQFSPDLVLSYGCHKLSDAFMKAVSSAFWNTHGGLSPDYRGTITHFWPSYFLEPQMTGMTLHETTPELDGGGIIFQTAAPMVRGDSLHQLAARNVEIYATELAEKLTDLDFSKLPAGITQAHYGKVFRSSDWRPEHLRLIYEVYQDKVVDAVLDGHIKGREPTLVCVL
ncbi:Phosphoribosylglycinamide formyltransferase [Marinomonas aquimarina]|uniref:phosphoribosylglycinamide formyltransferase 1 n=1 Tax=Marinomonas aquimarina TaxID=295068 RepID=A0A1A8TPS2_9GAMM|nr:formyl transferase [Marinomonas aquimarina]SBS34753.1 Phosphoribosylglycinamide formyltransferase [Marinomonas aquimarina]